MHLDENLCGFYLYCYEGEEVVHEQFFRDTHDAHIVGNMFLDGKYIKGILLEELV